MAGRTRKEWQAERSAWTVALIKAARAAGEDSELYRILGSIAWGRFDGESQPGELKDNIIFGVGYLQGARDVALRAGRVFNLPGTVHLERIHDAVREAKR